MVSRVVNIAMRGLQFLWTLLIMALVGNMIATGIFLPLIEPPNNNT